LKNLKCSPVNPNGNIYPVKLSTYGAGGIFFNWNMEPGKTRFSFPATRQFLLSEKKALNGQILDFMEWASAEQSPAVSLALR
jgi:hypothetical protein